jgi:hypothetical protein
MKDLNFENIISFEAKDDIALAQQLAQCTFEIVYETEKAYKLHAESDFGSRTFWTPKSVAHKKNNWLTRNYKKVVKHFQDYDEIVKLRDQIPNLISTRKHLKVIDEDGTQRYLNRDEEKIITDYYLKEIVGWKKEEK